jgi:enterochelin esterase family protein
MKILKTITVALILSFAVVNAQESLDFSGKKELVSPEVKGSSITFRLKAPEAKSVKLMGNWLPPKGWEPGTVDLQKKKAEFGKLLKIIFSQIYTPIHLL